MKHTTRITVILLLTFVLSQVIGLVIVNQYIDYSRSQESGSVVLSDLPFGERPTVEDESFSFIHIFVAVIIGTLLVFAFVRFRFFRLWKAWYWFAVMASLTAGFGAFTPLVTSSSALLAVVLAVVFATYKVLRPNIIVHNLTELFIYGGLVAIFIQILNIFSAIVILVLISLYDMYAVWRSKHMQKLAKFQSDSKVFAGLFIPYKLPKRPKKRGPLRKMKIKTAILGGGDIGFPLFFTGTVLKGLALTYSPLQALLRTFIVTVFVSLALLFLLVKSEEDRFYPAMPFISVGCFVGYSVLLLFGLL